MARVSYGELSDDAEPIADLLDRKAKQYTRKAKRAAQEKWLPVYVPEHTGLPFGVMWFGDMHIDDDGCNVPQLRADLSLCAKTEGCYGAHIGDITNNWVGRLNSEHAKQSTSQRDARRLARHVIHDSGVQWMVWLLGNHDLWNEGGPILSLIADAATHVAEWDARLEIRYGAQGAACSGTPETWRVHASHAFKGSSMWNPTHGPSRAAQLSTDADLCVAGHIHTPGTQGFEVRERYARVVQARGYKHFAQYAKVKGYADHQNGAAVLSIFHPGGKGAGRITTFEDVALGCRVLSLLRSYAEAQAAFAALRPQARPNPSKARIARPSGRNKPARRAKKQSRSAGSKRA